MNYQVNLLPVELQPKPSFRPKTVALALILVLIFGCMGFAYGYYSIQLGSVKGEVSFLNLEQKRLLKTENGIKELAKEQQTLQEQIKTLNGLADDRKTWPKMLLSINQSVPDSVWIRKLSLTGFQQQEKSQQPAKPSVKETLSQETTASTNPNNQPKTSNSSNKGESQDEPKVPKTAPNFLSIEGGSYSVEGIGKFVYSLQQLPYLSDVELTEITQDEKTGKYIFVINGLLKEGQR